MKEIVGANIRRLRKAKGWTILELAAAVHSDVGNISRLERGKQGFSDVILAAISDALEVAPMELFVAPGAASVSVVEQRVAASTTGKAVVSPAQASANAIADQIEKIAPNLRAAALLSVKGVLQGFISANNATATAGAGDGHQNRGGGREKKLREKT